MCVCGWGGLVSRLGLGLGLGVFPFDEKPNEETYFLISASPYARYPLCPQTISVSSSSSSGERASTGQNLKDTEEEEEEKKNKLKTAPSIPIRRNSKLSLCAPSLSCRWLYVSC